jgi:hypothetical protein
MSPLRILFINPCLRKKAPTKILPMGLAYVMTFAKEKGFAFDLLDVDIHEYDDTYVENFIRDNRYDVILYGSIVTPLQMDQMVNDCHQTAPSKNQNRCGKFRRRIVLRGFFKHAPADVAVIG